MTVDRAIEILNPEHREQFESIDPVNEACRMGMEALKRTQWTPVSEGLPEDGEDVLCWYEYFRYGEYNRMFQTFGIGYQYFGTWSGEVSIGRDTKVLAWMPLPEPPKMDGGADHETDTVDAVPVVRCRDCKYSYEDISGRCCSHGPCKDWVVLDDSFCSQGERRDDNDGEP